MIDLVDGSTQTYSFLGRYLGWKNLKPEENQLSKKHIDGYARIFRDGRTGIYKREKAQKGS